MNKSHASFNFCESFDIRKIRKIKRLMINSHYTVCPVVYISRALTCTAIEMNYTQIKKEALAFTWVCVWFHQYLIGLHFKVLTDYKLMMPLLSTKSLDQLPARVLQF